MAWEIVQLKIIVKSAFDVASGSSGQSLSCIRFSKAESN